MNTISIDGLFVKFIETLGYSKPIDQLTEAEMKSILDATADWLTKMIIVPENTTLQ